MLIIWSFVVLIVFFAVLNKIFSSENGRWVTGSDSVFSKYKLKDKVMNASEKTFYQMLKRQLPDKYLILSKVRIEDFVEVPYKNHSYLDIQSLRSRVKSRHVDFLICALEDTKPLLAVELDGPSHYKKDRIFRDMFIDGLYKNIGLPVKHIKTGSDFAAEIVEIKRFLGI
jgi:hypothetical protein